MVKPRRDGVSVLDKVLRKLVEADRKKNDRDVQTTMLIVDSKSIQNAEIAEKKGYDVEKSLWGKTAYWSGCFGAASRDYGDNSQITDRSDAIDIIDYYCGNRLQRMEATLEKILPTVSKLFLMQMLRLLSTMNFTHLLSCPNAGS